jgi:hypothetical protein
MAFGVKIEDIFEHEGRSEQEKLQLYCFERRREVEEKEQEGRAHEEDSTGIVFIPTQEMC